MCDKTDNQIMGVSGRAEERTKDTGAKAWRSFTEEATLDLSLGFEG